MVIQFGGNNNFNNQNTGFGNNWPQNGNQLSENSQNIQNNNIYNFGNNMPQNGNEINLLNKM